MKKVKDFFKKITLRRLIVLIILLMFNSYAWFIYATKVYSSLTTHVVAWEIKFQSGLDEIVSNMIINVEKIYPGMEDFEQELDAQNAGETDAIVTYAIREMTILGTTYSTADGDYTPDDLLGMLQDGRYPFEFSIIISNDGEMVEGRNL